MKRINLNSTVYEITEQYPELIDILPELGFVGVKNPIARRTVGKLTTLTEGAKKLGIDLNKVIEKLREEGFELENF